MNLNLYAASDPLFVPSMSTRIAEAKPVVEINESDWLFQIICKVQIALELSGQKHQAELFTLRAQAVSRDKILKIIEDYVEVQ